MRLPAGAPSSTAAIAQNWRDLRAERALSTFDQRHLLNLTAQYTSGEGLGGGTLMSGWRGRLLKEWTVLGTFDRGHRTCRRRLSIRSRFQAPDSRMSIRPNLTGAPIYSSAPGAHLNAAAYEAPPPDNGEPRAGIRLPGRTSSP